MNKEKSNLWVFNYQVAQRNAVINKTTVSFTAKFRILNDQKLVKYTEIVRKALLDSVLVEICQWGVGTKAETYKVEAGGGERERLARNRPLPVKP